MPGRGTGSFIGGILIANFGTRTTFRIIGAMAGIGGFLFLAIYLLFTRKIEKSRLRKRNGKNLFPIIIHDLLLKEIIKIMRNRDLSHISADHKDNISFQALNKCDVVVVDS